MATRYWTGNNQNTAQVDTFTVTGAALNATVTITINGKLVTYTMNGADTNTTAAAALAALLAASTYPEFAEITWTAATTVVTGTGKTAGTPFTAAASSAGGATLTIAHPTLNSSESDVNAAANWSGTTLPTNGDDVIFDGTNIPALWNLSSLSAVTLNSLTVWNSFEGVIGLPEINLAGYVEYRPTYFAIGASSLVIGFGSVGIGSGLMRFNVGTAQCTATVLGTGSPEQGTDYALRFLGSHASNALKVVGGTVAVAMLPSETATLLTALVQGNGILDIGALASVPTATCDGAQLNLQCPVTSLTINGGIVQISSASGYGSVIIQNGASVTWLNGGTIAILQMVGGVTLDAGQDARAKQINVATIDGTATVNDPYNTITWNSPATIVGPVTAGIFIFGSGRTVEVA